ncbi:MAG: uncharacterized protein JWQ04_3177, partial [Pedosphaera sp.]|nr:uncharacterized protein [Pedosphaera sp.]
VAMTSKPKFELGVIILAAGQSSRMGRPKMLLSWGENTVLGHLIELWSQLPTEQVVVVCAKADSGIRSELDRLHFTPENRVVNLDPARGMFSSVQCAARWKGWHPTLTHWAVALGDQPHLQPATLQSLVGFAKQHPEKICQPSRSGHPRHPVLFPRSPFKTLARSRSKTLKDFLEKDSAITRVIELNDAGLDHDLDHPSDYEAALKLFPPQ